MRIIRAIAVMGALCAALAILWMRCPRGPYRLAMPPNKEFVLEVPSDWTIYDKDDTPGGRIHALGDSNDAGWGPSIYVIKEEKSYTIESLARELREQKEHLAASVFKITYPLYPEYSESPITAIRFGEFAGVTYFKIKRDPRDDHPETYRTLYKETFIYFDTPRGPYKFAFRAPAATCENYRPAFEHALGTFRLMKDVNPLR